MIIDIQPTVALAFRLVLGSPAHSAVTVHFLNAVLEGIFRIRQATILNPSLEQETTDDQLTSLKIRAQEESGQVVNIELQTSSSAEQSLYKKLLYRLSQLYCNQIREGLSFWQFCPAVSISVLSKSLFPNNPCLHSDFRFRDKRGLVLSNYLQLHLIELPKATANVHNIADRSPVERWAFFFSHAHQIDADELRRVLPDPEFHEAMGVLEMIRNTPEIFALYQANLKAKLEEEARL